MADLFDLVAKLTLDSSEYESGLSSAQSKASSFGGALKSGLGTAAKVGAAGLAAMAGAAVGATTELTKTVSAAAQYGDNIDKMSQKMGMSATAYQEWDAIMQHSGTSMETLKAGMKTLANAVENDNKAFGRLGITQEQIAGMNNEQLFSATISALQNVDNETERTYLAGQLLGRGATELGALLNTSAEDTEAMRQRVHELGGVMSDEAVKASAKFQDNMQDLRTGIDGVKRSLTAELLPGFNDVIAGFTSMIIGEEGAEEQLTGGVQNIVSTFGTLMPRISGVISGIAESLISVAPSIVQGAVTLVQSLGSALLANAPMLTSTALQIVEILVQGVIQSAPRLLTGAMQIVTSLLDGLGQMAPMLITGAAQLVVGLAQALTDPASLSSMLQSAMSLVQGIADGLLQALPVLISAVPGIIQNLVSAITANAPQLIVSAGQIMIQLAVGLIQAIPTLLEALPEIIDSIAQGLSDLAPQLLEAGKTLAKSAWEGIKSIFKGGDKADASESVDFSGLESKTQQAASSMTSISSAASQTASSISSSFSSISTAADFTALGTNATTAFTGISTSAQTTATSITESFSSVGTGVGENINTGIQSVEWSSMSESASDTVKSIENSFSELPPQLKAIFEMIKTAVRDLHRFVKEQFTQMAKEAVNAWQPVPNQINTYLQQIRTNVQTLSTNIETIFTTLTGKATQWGSDLMTNFINGIDSKMGDLTQKVQEVAQNVQNNVGFSEPKEGPLSDFHTYAPDMMKLFAQGIKENTGLVHEQVEKSFDFKKIMPTEMTYSTVTTGKRGVSATDRKLDQLTAIVNQYLPQLANAKVVMDSGVTVGALVPEIDKQLGQRYRVRERSNA